MSQQKMTKSLVAHYTVRKDLWQHKKANLAPLRKPEITSLKKNNQKNPRKNHYILSYAAHTNLKIILASDIFHIYFNNSKRVLCIYQLPLKMKKGVFLRFEPLLNYTAKGTLRN